MATRLYLRDLASYASGDGRLKQLSTTAGSSTTTTAVVNTVANATELIWTKTAGGLALAWVSAPLSASATVSGTISVSIQALESNMSANAGSYARIFKVASVGDWSAIGEGADGVELGTTNAQMDWTITPSSTAFSAGDRIAVVLYINSMTPGIAGGYTATLYYDGAAASAYDSYIEIAENVTFDADNTGAANYYANSGYFGAGQNPSLTSAIAGFQFYTESTANPAASLSLARVYPAGVSSSSNGYFCGGSTSSTNQSSEIDGLKFSDESAINPSATLSVARGYLAGLSSSSNGYFCGGGTYNTLFASTVYSSEIDGLKFSDESAINPSATLSVARGFPAGVYSSAKGYIGGGSNSSSNFFSEIDGIQFSDQSAINPSATLSVSRDSVTGVSSSERGYFAGGYKTGGSISNDIDGIQFSDESAINPAAVLATARYNLGGIASSKKGYFAGGASSSGSSSDIDGIQFSDESAINPASTLLTSNEGLTGVSPYIDYSTPAATSSGNMFLMFA